MKGIITIVCIMAGVLIMAAFYSISRQKIYLDACSRELQDSLIQAQEVKCDLQEMMHSTLVLSQQIVDGLEQELERMAKRKEPLASQISPQNLGVISSQPSESSFGGIKELATASKMRVHELADELGMSSKELIQNCRRVGVPVGHHMKVLDEAEVQYLREQLNRSQVITDQVDVPEQVKSFELRMADTKSNLSIKPGISNHENDFSLEEIKTAHPYIAVRTLCEQGYSSKEIARILDRGQGEVNLILNLARKKIG